MIGGNDMAHSVGIGIVGIGFMGWIHFQAIERLTGARVSAICSRDASKRSGDWTSIQGNFGPRGTQVDLAGRSVHSDLTELLADPAVDLVDLCVPNDQHAAQAIQALEAGKHVLVEKPIALTTADADAMVAAARANDRLLMVAHVLPFFPEFAFAREAIASGRFGRLRAAHLSRVIAKPTSAEGNNDSDRSGGPAIDLHIHDTHYIGLICGVPKAVRSRGVEEVGAMAYLSTQYLYEDPNIAVSAVSGALAQPGRSFAHGFEIYLERATLAFGFSSIGGQGILSPALSVMHSDGSVETPTLAGAGDPIDAFTAELGVAVDAVRKGVSAPGLSGDLARLALVVCQAEVESARTGRTIQIS